MLGAHIGAPIARERERVMRRRITDAMMFLGRTLEPLARGAGDMASLRAALAKYRVTTAFIHPATTPSTDAELGNEQVFAAAGEDARFVPCPVLLPDFSRRDGRPIERLDLAFSVFNRFDQAEFIVRRPTPVERDGRVVCCVDHYSEVKILPAANTLLCA